LHFAAAAALWGVSIGGHAQTSPQVTEADMARAARSQPRVTEADIERARKSNRMPTDAELARIPIPSTPNIDALPQPAVRRPVDLGALAKGYEQVLDGPPSSNGLATGPGLLIFVSFSMPQQTLSRLVDQAARAHATVIIRGFVNGSLQHTVAMAQRLIGARQVSFQIDPLAFDRFAVTSTPTFVLVKAGAVPASCAAGSCFAAGAFVSANGDVSLDYALEFFARHAPSFAKDAAEALRRMKG
jgi:conjugal transfer pilus assembly protein TrbC